MAEWVRLVLFLVAGALFTVCAVAIWPPAGFGVAGACVLALALYYDLDGGT